MPGPRAPLTWVEDIVYLGLGLPLAGSSLALLVSGVISFGQNLMARSLTANIVPMLEPFRVARIENSAI